MGRRPPLITELCMFDRQLLFRICFKHLQCCLIISHLKTVLKTNYNNTIIFSLIVHLTRFKKLDLKTLNYNNQEIDCF